MMIPKRGISLVLCLSVLFFLLSMCVHAMGAPSDLPRRIFILHSYESGHVCGQPQHDGVIGALGDAGFKDRENLEIRSYFMDTKRKNNTPELIDEQARIALKAIRSFRPDVLVTLDDNAFRTVALDLVDEPVSIVFCGMNGQPEDYNKTRRFMESRARPGHNITGVYEKLHFVDAIRVHSKLFPGLTWQFIDRSSSRWPRNRSPVLMRSGSQRAGRITSEGFSCLIKIRRWAQYILWQSYSRTAAEPPTPPQRSSPGPSGTQGNLKSR